MRFLSLFAGIGGMDLGLERAGMTCVGQCEIDPFCRKVLAKHWPNVWRHDDVRTLTGAMVEEHCGRIDLICGGFPCQDISNAGLRAGIDGARSGLWSEYARLVCEVRPRFVVVENVPALLGDGMDRVLGDLAQGGYDAEWDCIPAAAVGAPHKRDRVFVVAYPGGERLQRDHNSRRFLGATMAPTPGPPDEIHGLLRWDRPYREFLRVDDGASAIVDRVRGLGNAVVPQVAEYVGRLIMEPRP